MIYEEPETVLRLHGNYSLRIETTEYFGETEDLLRDDRDAAVGTNDNWWDRLGMDSPEPAVWQKLSLRLGPHWRAGGTTSRRLGDDDLFDTKKAYAGVEDIELGPVILDKLYVGNYQIAWGQGVIMESTDFSGSRRSGYGFGRRCPGGPGGTVPVPGIRFGREA